MKNILKRRNKKGFTIVELVIVIGVIGILSAILIPTFVNVTKNAERARTQANLANAYSAYAAEAADGYIDASTSDPKASITFVSQEEAVLKSGTLYYTYVNGWNPEGTSTAPTKEGYTLTLVSTADYSVYGGFTFYSFVKNA